MKKTLPVGGIKYGIRWVMLQIGSCCNNHLIINVIFKRLGVKAGKDSLPFAIFVTQNIYAHHSAATTGSRNLHCR